MESNLRLFEVGIFGGDCDEGSVRDSDGDFVEDFGVPLTHIVILQFRISCLTTGLCVYHHFTTQIKRDRLVGGLLA